jgi:pimeloyl-ACP methyl ester carboxylesterase
MAQWTRRQMIGTTAGVAVASLAASVWNLHQHLPARDPGAEERFLRAQAVLLAGNGNSVHSRFVQIAEPSLRVQVLEGGQGEPVLLLHGGDGVAAQWEPLLSRLSSGFHIYAPDRPGCGLTDMFNYHNVTLREHAVDFVLRARWMRSDSKLQISLAIRWAAISPSCSPWRTRSG